MFGRILVNTATSAAATAANQIAGATQKIKTMSSTKSVIVVSNLAGTDLGMRFDGSYGLVTKIDFSLIRAPIGTITVRVRRGSTNSTATVIGSYSITGPAKTISHPVAIPYTSSEGLYFDVTSTGGFNTPGVGLSISVSYYSG